MFSVRDFKFSLSFSGPKLTLPMTEWTIPAFSALNSALPALHSETAFFKGVELILKQLMDTLYKFGLEEIDALNQDFDPNFHHAVIQEEADEPDKVIDVLQKGYKLKDKVIRPSMVKVSK